MPILTKEVEVKVNSNTVKYYESLGYKIPLKMASKLYQKNSDKKYVYDFNIPIKVKVEHLMHGSNTLVEVLCDMCHENKMLVAYQTYNRVVKNTGSYVCKECGYIKKCQSSLKKYGVLYASQSEAVKEKVKLTNLERYGVENYGQTQECREKVKQTCLDRYNVEHFAKTQEIKDKKAQTNLERYGVPHVSQVEEFKEKIASTNIERYGVRNPSKLPEIQEKIRQSNIEKYGVPYVMQSPDVLKRAKETLCKNGRIQTSKQQLYLHSIYGGELNCPIKYYAVDICIPKEKIAIEYDGGGHNLMVTLGRLTQEEFNQKELIRDKVIKSEGYKIIRIKSDSDLLPTDHILLQMLSEAKQYFSETAHSWMIYDIDNSRMINATNKDANGIPYSFGELRKIKDSDLPNNNNTNNLKGA